MREQLRINESLQHLAAAPGMHLKTERRRATLYLLTLQLRWQLAKSQNHFQSPAGATRGVSWHRLWQLLFGWYVWQSSEHSYDAAQDLMPAITGGHESVQCHMPCHFYIASQQKGMTTQVEPNVSYCTFCDQVDHHAVGCREPQQEQRHMQKALAAKSLRSCLP